MIKTLIFDFGNVFINLNIEAALQNALKTFKTETLSDEIIKVNNALEQGLISPQNFVAFYTENFPNLSKEEVIEAWNFILKDFPKYRLDFLKELKSSTNFKLILLSNTNTIHIDYIKKHVSFYEEFKSCFDVFYLSHEINLVKPNQDIFEFVLNENQLKAEECLFIDDNKDNINTANNMKFNTWHINPGTEDVVNLFDTKKHLFK